MSSKYDVKVDENYQEWLENSGKKDTRLNREWYNCPEDERAEFMEKHKEWFRKY